MVVGAVLGCVDATERVVGAVVSGGLIGILVSRTVSGLIADAFGWRAIYIVAAVAAVILAVVLRVSIPQLQQRTVNCTPAPTEADLVEKTARSERPRRRALKLVVQPGIVM